LGREEELGVGKKGVRHSDLERERGKGGEGKEKNVKRPKKKVFRHVERPYQKIMEKEEERRAAVFGRPNTPKKRSPPFQRKVTPREKKKKQEGKSLNCRLVRDEKGGNNEPDLACREKRSVSRSLLQKNKRKDTKRKKQHNGGIFCLIAEKGGESPHPSEEKREEKRLRW